MASSEPSTPAAHAASGQRWSHCETYRGKGELLPSATPHYQKVANMAICTDGLGQAEICQGIRAMEGDAGLKGKT